MFLFPCVIRWFPNSPYLICLFDPWRRQPCAGLPRPRQAGLRIRVGLPTQDKSQKKSSGTLLRCSFLSTYVSRRWTDTQGVSVRYQPCGNDLTPLATEAPVQFQPGGNNLTPLAGDSSHSTAIVDAQLTPPISRDDDTETPAARLMHDNAHRQQNGSRCRKRAVSTQHTTVKRKSAACCMCGQQFSHGEACLQQWSNRNSQRAYVHAQCVNGGVAHDHELHPKQPADQDAVDAVARQRDCVIQAGADSEVLLPLAPDSDEASTAAPADDEPSLFGREEVVRLDEETLDFLLFDTVTWSSIKDFRGTTCVQPAPRFRFALQQAQHAILCAIMHPGPSSPASESAWKVLVLSSWLLLGRPAVNASGSNCEFLEARLDLSWSEDWPALWAMVRAECDVAPVFSTSRKSGAEQKQSRVRKVATLAQSGERGRALAAARNAPPVPVTQQIVQEIESLHPADPGPALATRTPVSNLFLSQVAELIPNTLRRMPRLSEPGPLGRRAEHWYDGEQAGESNLFVQVVARIAAAAVPHSLLQNLRSGQVTPLDKPTGGHRPLLMMSFLRRLDLKSVMAAKKESVAKCAGPLQYGVGRPDGANTMVKAIQYLAETDPTRVLVALDLKAAIQNVSRRAMLNSTLIQTSLVSSPNGTQAPPSTGCTSSPPTPRSLPPVVLFNDVLHLWLLCGH